MAGGASRHAQRTCVNSKRGEPVLEKAVKLVLLLKSEHRHGGGLVLTLPLRCSSFFVLTQTGVVRERAHCDSVSFRRLLAPHAQDPVALAVAEGLASVPLARVEELDERLEERLVDPRRACAAAKITLTAALWLLRRVEA